MINKIIIPVFVATVLTALLIIVLFSTMPQHVYAQIPGITTPPSSQDQQQQSQSTQLPAQHSSSTSSFVTYKDPQGRFSIDYPSDWIVKPRQNRFQAFDVRFSSSSMANGYVAVIFKTLETPAQQSLLPDAFTAFLNGFSPSIPNFSQVGDTSYTKYKVAGHDAASIEFTSSLGQTQGFNLAGLLVFSLVDQNAFMLSYVADQNVYDKVLPNVEHMIDSFQPSPSS